MNPMRHVLEIVTWFSQHASKKYMAGQEEHGGRLWRKPVWKFMRDEVIDQVVYFYVLEEQQEAILEQLRWSLEAIPEDPDAASMFLKNAINILETGNVEGIQEEER